MRSVIKRGRNKAAAVAMAVLVSLAGCNSVPEGYVPEGYVPEGYVPEGYVPAGYISIEDAQALFSALTLPVGYLDGTGEEISNEDGDKISKEVMTMESSFVAADAPQVKARDWSLYASRLAKEGLIFEEAAFYDRLDQLCLRYIDSAALDGVRMENADYTASDMVSFGDLNLTREQAQNVAFWFKYNNPQYYFISSSVMTTSSQKLCFCIYDFAADGEERAEITNQLFDKLDGWIQSVDSQGATTWQKELAANNLLCKNIFYNYEYAENNDLIGQTLYSAVTLEGTVCAGYAAAFSAVMNALGTETVVALSPTHAWNVVRYEDGNYYAVDVTWNDNDEDDDNPDNKYFNVGETTLKMGDDGAHTYSAEYMAWSPKISQDDCSAENQSDSVARLDIPANLRVTSDEDGKVHLTWDSVEGVNEYVIEVYDPDITKLLVSSRIADIGVKLTYGSWDSIAVRVRAEKGEGEEAQVSDWSEFLIVDTKAKNGSQSEDVRPAAPENVKTVKEEPGEATFSWDPVEGADRYEIVLFTDSEHKETMASSVRTENSTHWVRFKSDTAYYFGVRAVKTVDGQDYCSDWNYFTYETPAKIAETTGAAETTETAETTGTAESEQLAAPTNLRTVYVEDYAEENTARTSWDPVPGAEKYQARRYKDSTYQEVIEELSFSGTYVNLTNSMEGESYYWAIRAVKTVDGKEIYSEWVDVAYRFKKDGQDDLNTYVQPHDVTVGIVASEQLAAPTNLRTFYVEDYAEENTARTSWDSVPGATKYQARFYKDSTYQEITREFSPSGTYFNGTNSKEGASYHYGIRAVKTVDGQEIYSDWVNFTYVFKKDSQVDLNTNVQ